MALFIGRIPHHINDRELEDYFSKYGKISRFNLKQGYGFVEFEDRRDAEEAFNKTREGQQAEFIVEWAKNNGRRTATDSQCFHCGEEGHWARNCSQKGGDRDQNSRRFRDRPSAYSSGGGSSGGGTSGGSYHRNISDRSSPNSYRAPMDGRRDERRRYTGEKRK